MWPSTSTMGATSSSAEARAGAQSAEAEASAGAPLSVEVPPPAGETEAETEAVHHVAWQWSQKWEKMLLEFGLEDGEATRAFLVSNYKAADMELLQHSKQAWNDRKLEEWKRLAEIGIQQILDRARRSCRAEKGWETLAEVAKDEAAARVGTIWKRPPEIAEEEAPAPPAKKQKKQQREPGAYTKASTENTKATVLRQRSSTQPCEQTDL